MDGLGVVDLDGVVANPPIADAEAPPKEDDDEDKDKEEDVDDSDAREGRDSWIGEASMATAVK